LEEMLFKHEDDQNHLANKKNIENLDFPSHVSCQQSDEEEIHCTNHENSAVIQNCSFNRPEETNRQVVVGETQYQLHYILNDDQSKSQKSYELHAVDNQRTIQNTIHDNEEGLQSICNNINDCSNEIHEQKSSPLGIKQTSNPYSSVPSFMEPSRHHFQSMMCCNDPCCKEACEYTNSSSIGTEIMQFSWNVDDPQFSGSLMPFPSYSDENVTVPVYRWNGHIVSLPTHSLQLPTSLNQISSQNLFTQTQSNKRTMQEELFSDFSLNELNKPYALPTISNVHQQTSSFRKRNSPVTLLSLESTVEYEQDTFKQLHAKYETYKFQPRIDLYDIVPEMPEPPADLNDPKPDAQPRRQKLKYPGDMYTPQWVRYPGHSKEGFCNDCKPGKWLQLKNSAYWYHKQFFHGISSVSGKMFVPPVETRKFESGD
ncbi:25789_t:CDS:2, partial [Gigaspora rosea]